MTSALSQVGPASVDRLAVPVAVEDLAQREDRRVHVLGHHIGVAAVYPVVEVVPIAPVAHGTADHAGQQRHAVGGKDPTGLGQQREFVAPVTERLVDDVCDRADRRHLLAIAHRKATADIDDFGCDAERFVDVGDKLQCAAQRSAVRLWVVPWLPT